MRALPLGGKGVLVIAVVAVVAFTLGQFAFFGFEFLTHLPLLLGGWFSDFVFWAIWGTVIECFVWTGKMGRWSGTAPSSRSSPVAQRWLGAVLIVLLSVCWLAHQGYQCLLVTMPFLGLLVFTITGFFQLPIIQPFRNAGHDGAAFAALLVLEAVMMFLTGEMMAVDHFRKGLEYFQNDHRAVLSIQSSNRTDFYFDYEQKEVVLKARTGRGAPIEVHRSFADFDCK